MRKADVLYGTVSALRSVYTVRYRRNERESGITRSWYSPALFDDLPRGTPVVRFDLMERWPGVFPGCNADFHAPTSLDRTVVTTERELAWYREHGVPVQEWQGALDAANDMISSPAI